MPNLVSVSRYYYHDIWTTRSSHYKWNYLQTAGAAAAENERGTRSNNSKPTLDATRNQKLEPNNERSNKFKPSLDATCSGTKNEGGTTRARVKTYCNKVFHFDIAIRCDDM